MDFALNMVINNAKKDFISTKIYYDVKYAIFLANLVQEYQNIIV